MQLTEEKRVLNNINIDSLEQQTENLEKKIIEAIPSLKSMIVQNGIDVKTVSNHLKTMKWLFIGYHLNTLLPNTILIQHCMLRTL
jgi:hypothetical protein